MEISREKLEAELEAFRLETPAATEAVESWMAWADETAASLQNSREEMITAFIGSREFKKLVAERDGLQ